jgi:hypothetical protein
MTFPHPKSRKDEYGKEEEPSGRGVVGDFFERAINITEDRNTEDEMNPANDRTLGSTVHDWLEMD